MAGLYLDTPNIQATIDLAVNQLLEKMREVPGFSDSLRSAEAHRQDLAGIRAIPSAEEGPEPDASVAIDDENSDDEEH